MNEEWYKNASAFKLIGLDGNGEPFELPLQIASAGKPALPVVVDGLAPTQSRLTANTYATTTIYAVEILSVGTGNLTLSPLSGDTDIVVTAAELTAMGISVYNKIFYGPFDSVIAGSGMSLLLHTE